MSQSDIHRALATLRIFGVCLSGISVIPEPTAKEITEAIEIAVACMERVIRERGHE